MKKPYLFELCAENLNSALSAEAGGADRIELCSQLSIGGVTPDHDLLTQVLQALTIPVHVLIRPRGGDFVYSGEEFLLLKQQTVEAKAAGAAGIAVGVLLADGRVDVERTRQIVELAAPMKVTFHRAFDEIPAETQSLSEALEDVMLTGADCLLTSGGEPNMLAGAEAIASLRKQAGDRLAIMAGAGLTLTNLVEVVEKTGVHYLHGSLTRKTGIVAHAASDVSPSGVVLTEDVREAVRLFKETASSQFTH